MNHRELRALRKADHIADTTDFAEALDRAEHGQVVELARFREKVGAPASIERPEPVEAEDAFHIAASLATARDELVRGAMRRLDEVRDRPGASDLHLKVGLLVLDLEELQREMAERWGPK